MSELTTKLVKEIRKRHTDKTHPDCDDEGGVALCDALLAAWEKPQQNLGNLPEAEAAAMITSEVAKSIVGSIPSGFDFHAHTVVRASLIDTISAALRAAELRGVNKACLDLERRVLTASLPQKLNRATPELRSGTAVILQRNNGDLEITRTTG